MLSTNIEWEIEDNKYIIRNVPYEKLDAEGEDFFDLDVIMKIGIIRDLMVMNDIPNDVDFGIVEDLTFSNMGEANGH